VLGPPQDIREVQNAYEAYEMLTKLNPYGWVLIVGYKMGTATLK